VSDLDAVIELVSAASDVMQEWIRNLGNPQAQSGGAKRDDDDENREPSGRSALVEDVGLFRRERGCGLN
jgi:hypothetical protein